MNQGRFHLSQYRHALANANLQHAKILAKYPNLKCYPVLVLNGEQTNLDTEIVDALYEASCLLKETSLKWKVMQLLKQLLPKDAQTKEQILLRKKIKQMLQTFEFNGEVQVEIRFHRLNYDLIWQLQADELVDRKLTPQTRASIRIVLGKISDFAEAKPSLEVKERDVRSKISFDS